MGQNCCALEINTLKNLEEDIELAIECRKKNIEPYDY